MSIDLALALMLVSGVWLIIRLCRPTPQISLSEWRLRMKKQGIGVKHFRG